MRPLSFHKRGSLLGIVLALICLAPTAAAQERSAIEAALETVVPEFSVVDRDAREVFEGIARSYTIPLVIEQDVGGKITFRIFGAKLRNVLDAVCAPHGWHYEMEAAGYLVIRKYITRSYSVDYLQMTQQGSSSASVSLTGGASSGGSGQNGQNGSAVAAPVSGGGANGTAGTAGGSGSGSSTIALNATNEADFWGRFETDVRQFLNEGEKLVINRFAGVVQLRATLLTHAQMDTYIKQVMRRVRRSAKITVRQVRVDFNNVSAFGIDWSVAQFRLGSGSGRNVPQVGGAFTPITGGDPIRGFGTATNSIGEVAGQSLPGETFRMVIAAGKVSALITALQEQGSVRLEDRSSASTLNNQMALIQISEDRPLFRRTFTSSTTTGAQAGAVTQNQSNYEQENVSFGNVLEVTPQIDDNLITTLALSPSLTDFRGSVTSPDGASSAFIVGVKRYRSTVVLRNGETAVIGGFIQTAEGSTNRAVPGLSKLPLVGKAFQSNAKTDVKSELVLLITVEAEDPTLPQPVKVAQPNANQISATATGASPMPHAEQKPGAGKVELVGANRE